jgi:predicted transcriptional regulator
MLSSIIQQTYSTLEGLGKSAEPAAAAVAAEPEKREPAVSIRASVKPDYLVSLFDGSKHKMLRRYLQREHNMTPEQYRAHWGLPSDYPMVAPSYSEKRRALAKAIGLGTKGRAKTEAVEALAAVTDTDPKVVEAEVSGKTEQAPAKRARKTKDAAAAQPEAAAPKRRGGRRAAKTEGAAANA